MKNIFLGFCIITFSISVVIADEIATRLGYNCVERLKLKGVSSDRALPECLVKLENMVAQQGSQATFKEYEYVWSPNERDKAFSNITAKIAMERGYNTREFKKIVNEWIKLEQNDDYRTLACLFIGNPNTRCLK